jgi:hypothetical protein
MTDKNMFSLLGDMGDQDQDATAGPIGPLGTPGAGAASGQKRTVNDRSPEASKDDRTTKQTRIDLMGMCVDAATDMDNLKKVFSTTTLTVNDKTSWKDAKDKFLGLFGAVVDTMERNMNTVTDVAAVVEKYESRLEAKDKIIQGLEEKIATLEKRKDSQEVKDSQEIMTSEIRQAMTHFKVMDLDVGRDTDNRKDIIDNTARAINEKVRTDLSGKWAAATRTAKVVPLGRKTVKRTVDGKEINTVPVLIRIEDREDRWQAEEVLRKSNVHPSFHWPQGMMGHVKKFRQAIIDSGISEQDNYIRIRPEERNGKMRIRGDVKAKVNGRFETRVYWQVPPMDSGLIVANPDLVKPQWVGPQKEDQSRVPVAASRRSRARSFRPSVTVTLDKDGDSVFSQDAQTMEN